MRRYHKQKKNSVTNQSGAVLIVVALMLVVLLGIAALAIDIGHLMLVRNELRNAADAGALAGARMLYAAMTPGSTDLTVNAGANTVAYNAATANASDNSPVEVLAGNIERGHWCFACSGSDGEQGTFTPNDSLAPYNFVGLSPSPAALDADPNYINAVRVVASRGPGLPAASFFARIFGFESFSLNAEAVAWVGFAGSNIHVDQPIAICQENIFAGNGALNCTAGRMINSSGSETGAWTNLEQGENACNGAASASEIRPLVEAGCSSGEIPGITVHAGEPMTTVNGEVQSGFNSLYSCWMSNSSLDFNGDGKPDQSWSVTLPLIECSGNPPGPCNKVVGAVNVDVFWIINNNDPDFKDIPTQYDVDRDTPGMEYSCPEVSLYAQESAARKLCWLNFLNAFGVKDASGNALTMDTAANLHVQKSIYFKPSCSLASEGSSGGAPANVVAKIPKLVR